MGKNNLKDSKNGKSYYYYYNKVDRNKKYEYPISLIKEGYSIKDILNACAIKNIKISESTIRRLIKEMV